MLTIILITLLGVGIGYLCHGQRWTRHLSRSISLTICFMLLVLGLSVGSDPRTMSGLPRFGLQALFLSLAGILGSCVAAYWLEHKRHHDREEGR
ncbi:MAG: LysO family transporter [Alloprevotella sp.]